MPISSSMLHLAAYVTTLASLGGTAFAAAAFNLISTTCATFLMLLAASVAAGIAVGQRAILFLGADEYMRFEGFSGAWVRNGPGVIFVNPFTYRTAEKRTAETLGSMDFVKIRDSMNGKELIQKGPTLLFPAAYDQIVEKGCAITLANTEYVMIEDKLSGQKTVMKGPGVWFPDTHEQGSKGTATSLSSTEYLKIEDNLTGERSIVKGPYIWFPKPSERLISKQTAIALKGDEYIKVKDTASGKRWVIKGKALVFLEPTWSVEGTGTGVQKAWALRSYQYIRLIDSVTGKVTVHCGEKTVFPGPDDELLDGSELNAIDLKVNEYVKILDQATAEIRVVSGRSSPGDKNLVFLGPNDKVLDGGKQKAITVDDDHAVLIRDKSNGQLRLVTEKQIFIPGPNECIEKVQDLIKLADHEALIVKNGDGQFQFYYGSEEKRTKNQPRSFFLPPYAEIVRLCWSKGRRRESRSLYIERFDCRAQFMSFEFNCRTSDNVELILEGTFFWEVVDLPAMVRTTGDTSGDLCNHARSQFIRHVARVTLKEFMDESHAIAKKVWEEDTGFYDSRGVKIHSLEVTRYQCADQSTSEILEQIIQETTNRMNRLSQAESENEVNLFRTQGQIEQERLSGDLLAIQHEHAEKEAMVQGRSEAKRVEAFVDELEDKVPDLKDRIELWQVLRKKEALAAVSQGGASLYYTPNDVNLSIEARK
eukprot:TRINITY_DN678_c1_g1_i1.p1 TRINITY_DN678_c1_g1~~TRINITY_DN678_c1_g1_i1.p1  ORF type:complete len:705 (-),score=141.18 TRINITY_DN678_c1_g1_i1:350-2464(-)